MGRWEKKRQALIDSAVASVLIITQRRYAWAQDFAADIQRKITQITAGNSHHADSGAARCSCYCRYGFGIRHNQGFTWNVSYCPFTP